LLIYSRLLGRIGWVFGQQQAEEDEDDDEEAAAVSSPGPPPGKASGGNAKSRSSPPVKPTGGIPGDSDPWSASLEQALRKGTKPAPLPSAQAPGASDAGGDSFELLPEDRPWQKVPVPKRRSPSGPIQPFPLAAGGDPKQPK